MSKISRKPLAAIAVLPLDQLNLADSSMIGRGMEKLALCSFIIIETCELEVLGTVHGSSAPSSVDRNLIWYLKSEE